MFVWQWFEFERVLSVTGQQLTNLVFWCLVFLSNNVLLWKSTSGWVLRRRNGASKRKQVCYSSITHYSLLCEQCGHWTSVIQASPTLCYVNTGHWTSVHCSHNTGLMSDRAAPITKQRQGCLCSVVWTLYIRLLCFAPKGDLKAKIQQLQHKKIHDFIIQRSWTEVYNMFPWSTHLTNGNIALQCSIWTDKGFTRRDLDSAISWKFFGESGESLLESSGASWSGLKSRWLFFNLSTWWWILTLW